MKTSGMGMALFYNGHDLSGDVGSINTLRASRAELDVTGLDKHAHERIAGLRDGQIDFHAYYNPSPGQEHPVLREMPINDVIVIVCFGLLFGSPTAMMIAKQVDFSEARTPAGALEDTISTLANSYGLNWGHLLTAGSRVDTGPTVGPALQEAATALGWAAYLCAEEAEGGECTVTIQDSADDVTYVALGSFQAFAEGPYSERIMGAQNAPVAQYTRVVTTGTFTRAVFVVAFTRNRSL